MCVNRSTVTPVFLDLRGDKVARMEAPPEAIVMCLGNFDGVHTAHAALLRRGLALRDEKLPGCLCGVFTFFHPSSDYSHLKARAEQHTEDSLVLRKPAQQRHLTTLKEKIRLFKEQGMEFVCLCDFNQIRTLPAQDFLSFLSHDLMVRGAVCGFNYQFGMGGRGTSELLKTHFDRPEAGFFYSIAPPYRIDGETVSSTRIRKLLSEGQAATAAKHLGHPYTLERKVVAGKRLGRKLGFPTANQHFLPESLIPAHGVYAVRCHTPLGIFPGVANVGSHPTVDKHAAVNCETYIIGPSQDLYGYRMRVEFLYRLRDEQKFDSVESLTQAIARDAAAAEAYINQTFVGEDISF